ncbi:hypothetical protein C8R46DRAFT_645950 [Mycena filopes]|nr:hypothetical protein C8R46DRAFT_645950 [Mycena filopes]
MFGYDYEPYDRAMSDPEFWVVKAEERRAWSTEATLLSTNLNFSRPVVTPFVVASPAVNYPPAIVSWRDISVFSPIGRHAYSDLGYHYVAVVTFTDGSQTEVPAGYTNFRPTSPTNTPKTPFVWNATLMSTNIKQCSDRPELSLLGSESDSLERCLSKEQQSVFVAEVTLDDGNTVRRGERVKGRVTVHATNGSTKMTHVTVAFASGNDRHWAAKQANAGGDKEFLDLFCSLSPGPRGVRSVEDSAYLFESDNDGRWEYNSDEYGAPSNFDRRGRLTSAKPYLDFELPISQTAVPDLPSYYNSGVGMIGVFLTVSYSPDLAACIRGTDPSQDLTAEDEASQIEAALWDSYTPVVPQEERWNTLELYTMLPLVILGDASERPVQHYLEHPDLPSPVILASPLQQDIVFPSAHPLIIEEPLANTSARLMRWEGTSDPFQSHRNYEKPRRYRAPDPAARYNRGDYAALLWKKKLFASASAEDMSPPVGAQGESSDSQQRLVGP